jgi:hypothetical protein
MLAMFKLMQEEFRLLDGLGDRRRFGPWVVKEGAQHLI